MESDDSELFVRYYRGGRSSGGKGEGEREMGRKVEWKVERRRNDVPLISCLLEGSCIPLLSHVTTPENFDHKSCELISIHRDPYPSV